MYSKLIVRCIRSEFLSESFGMLLFSPYWACVIRVQLYVLLQFHLITSEPTVLNGPCMNPVYDYFKQHPFSAERSMLVSNTVVLENSWITWILSTNGRKQFYI
jgi:hypothetical protein